MCAPTRVGADTQVCPYRTQVFDRGMPFYDGINNSKSKI